MAPAMASAAIIALLVLLAAPAHAGRPGPASWVDSDFARIGRDLLTSAADYGTTCPAGYFKPPETPPAVPAFTDAATNSATLAWDQLRQLGWDLPATRPTTDEWYNLPTQYANTQYSSTFWSVQCNGKGFVTTDGRGCTANKGPGASEVEQSKTYGATHVRYNCTTQSFWILTYAFAGEDFSNTGGNMWAVTCQTTATGLGTCDSSNPNKFLSLEDGANSPSDAGTCGGNSVCDSQPSSDWCCQDMWAIVEGTNNEDWFGWLGQARFQLEPNTNTTSSDTQVHWNSNGDTTSQSNARNLTWNGMCLDCGRRPAAPPPGPPPGESCTPPTVTVAPPASASVCSDATEQLLTYSVDNSRKVNVSVTSPANCRANVTEVPAGGGAVEVNCTAPWSGASFEVSLLVEGDCEFIQTFGVPVTYNVRPTVTVTPEDDDDFICSTDDTAVYTFRVTSDVIAPEPNNQITVTITDDADSACTFTGTTETSGLAFNDTVVSVTCSKPSLNGWSGSLGFSLEASYGPSGCDDDNSADAGTSVTPEPDVRVEINKADIEEKCDADSDDIVFKAYVYNDGTSQATLNVNASWVVDGNDVACTVNPNTDVDSGDDVAIRCTKPGGGYVAGEYLLTVSAQAGVDGCTDTESDTATLTINAKPTVTIDGPTTGQQVCEDKQSFSFKYTFTTAPEGNLLNLTVPSQCNNFTYMSGDQAVNTASPDLIPAGEVEITCDKGLVAEWTGSTFDVGVTATAGATDCTNSTSQTNVITINQRPDITVTGPGKVTQCSSGNSGVFEFSVTGLTGFESTATFTPDWSKQFEELDCAQVTQGDATTGYIVTCTTTAATLPEKFNVSLAVSAGLASDCLGSKSATTEASVPCCGGGGDTAYAAVGVDDSLRSTDGNSKCFFEAGEDWSACGKQGNWGWRNKFTGEGTVDAAIYAGAAVTCKKTSKRVGTITATCANSGTGSNVTFSSLDNFGITPQDNHIYVGCAAWLGNIPVKNRSPKCTPSTFGATVRPSGTGMVACGGNENALLGYGRCGGNGIPTSFEGFNVPGCNCNEIYWIYHQSDNDWRFARQSDGSCSLPQ